MNEKLTVPVGSYLSSILENGMILTGYIVFIIRGSLLFVTAVRVSWQTPLRLGLLEC